MRNQLRTLILALLLIPATTMVAQSDYYFFYDPSCYQKFQYNSINIGQQKFYTDYYLSFSKEKKLIFRVNPDVLHFQLLNEIPVMPFMCSNSSEINEEMLNEINSRSKTACMVVEVNGKYALYKILKVSTLTETSDTINYHSPELSFNYRIDKSSPQEVLNPESNRNENIFYSAKDSINCLGRYKFQVIPHCHKDEILQISIIPGLGAGQFYQEKEQLELVSINDLPIDDFISQRCGNFTTGIDIAPTTMLVSSAPAKKKPVEENSFSSERDRLLIESKSRSGIPPPPGYLTKTQKSTLYSSKDQIIPQSSVETTKGFYTTRYQDNLYVISKKFNISINRLIDINGLKDYKIYVNQKIKVIDEEKTPVKTRYPIIKIDEISQSKIIIHLAQQGQTLYSIAKEYNLSLPEIYSLNQQLKSDKIDINQHLIVGIMKQQ